MALQMMMPNLKSLSLLLIFCMISSKLSYCNICPEIEKEVLLNFKESLKDPSNMLSSWNSSVDVNCCNWKGVVCDSITDHVRQLHLQFSGLGGKIDPSLLHLKNLRYLDLSQNNFEQTIPSFIGSLTSLEYLNLSHAGFYGTVPHSIGNLSNIHTLNLEINYYGSQLDVSSLEWVSELSQLEQLNMNSVSLSRAANWLQFLHLGGNQLSGEIPDCWMKWPLLTYLNLGNNKLPGTIPNSIGFLAELRSLNLRNNEISGQIPFSMRNCTKLVKIDLANNDLNGKIPTWMGTSLVNLWILILRSNKLSGEISSDLCRLNSLKILDVSDNGLYGIMPRCVGNFTSMATKRSLSGFGELDFEIYDMVFRESATVSTKGSEYQYDTILALVTNIDLSNNNLSGDIPNELTSLVELRSLNLSGNHFTGLIPQTIGYTKQLESLDLSRNSLSGEMPNSFRAMSTLNYLNVSYNHLTSRIPESTQLRGFDNSSFIGNDLCGFPLTRNCSFSGPNKREDNGSDDKSSSKIEWFYIFLSLR